MTHLGSSCELGTVSLVFVHLGSRSYNSKTKVIFRIKKDQKTFVNLMAKDKCGLNMGN